MAKPAWRKVPVVFYPKRRAITWRPAAKVRRRHLLCIFFLFVVLTFLCTLALRMARLRGRWSVRELLLSVFPFVYSQHGRLPPCNSILNSFGDFSRGPIDADTDSIPGIAFLEDWYSEDLLPGGIFVPKTCSHPRNVAVIVPIRDRRVHLKMFLRHMHPFLQRQDLHYGIFVVEQTGENLFNRALLLNAGYKEALRLHPEFDCFVFHDVDLLPLDDRIYYSCGDHPMHLSSSIDTHGNKLMYENLFGGVSMLTKEMMERVNGFSNVYFGWGGEDDDMSYRLRSNHMHIVRYDQDIARYTMIKHAKQDKLDRESLLEHGKDRIYKDGLNSLKYSVVDFDQKPLYTWIKISFNQSQVMEEQGLKDFVSMGTLR